jgi:hypothetical protein
MRYDAPGQIDHGKMRIGKIFAFMVDPGRWKVAI